MARCLRCNAGNEWIEGEVKPEVRSKKKGRLSAVRSNDLLSDNLMFLKKLIKAQSRLLVCYRVGGQPPEWVFDIIEKAKTAGIEC